jgi:hypothetical protein
MVAIRFVTVAETQLARRVLRVGSDHGTTGEQHLVPRIRPAQSMAHHRIQC